MRYFEQDFWSELIPKSIGESLVGAKEILNTPQEAENWRNPQSQDEMKEYSDENMGMATRPPRGNRIRR